MSNHNKLGRRNLMRNVLLAGGAAGLGAGGLGALSRLALGQESPEAEDRFYVFAYFNGGWDTLLGIDPRDPAVFNEDNIGATRIQPGYEMQAEARFQEAPAFAPGTEILLGPAARPLDAVASRLAVVRGMSMDTLTHEVGRRRFLTGKPPSGLQARGSSGSAWLAAQFGGSRLIPNLSVRVEAFNPELPPEASALRVGSASDMVELLRRQEPTMDEAFDLAVSDHHADESSCARNLSSPLLRASESARVRMRTVMEADVQSLFDFRADEMAAMRDRYAFATNELSSPGAQAALAYQALNNGVARVVTIQAASGLDAHFDDWEDEHAPRQYEGFDALARLALHLEETPYGDTGESMLDRTVICAFSEFMRTPLLNARGGRDHWLTNSCMLLGGSIKGGVIGASSDIGMAPQLVDVTTGRVTEDPTAGQIIYPEHIWRTLLTDAGLEEDRADLRVGPIPALLRS